MLRKLRFRSLLSSQATIYTLVLILVISIVLAIFVPPGEFSQSRIYVFMSILASVTVILIGLSLSVSSVALEEQEKVNRASFTKQAIDKLWLYPNELLTRSKLIRPEFLKSLYPNNLHLYQVKTHLEPETVLSILEEQNIAIVMIQAWEDYLTLREFEETGDEVWLTNFIQWAQSSYLKSYFELLKYNFKNVTIEFGHLLFEYARKLPLPTPVPESYRSVVKEMLQDPRISAVFKKSAIEIANIRH